jgi:hypothetical protein
MLLSVLIALLSSLYFYVQAIKTGLGAKRWAVAGLVFGPFILPMFKVKRHLALRKVSGFGSCILRA